MTRRLVLHVGPDASLKGGIASVIAGYKNESSEFELSGYKLKFLPTISSKPLKHLFFIRQLLRLMRLCLFGQVTLVHIHTSIKGSVFRKSIVALICVMMSQRYIIHVHSGRFSEFCGELWAPARRLVQLVLSRASAIICLSDHARSGLVADSYAEANKCFVIYNGSVDICADMRRMPKKQSSVVRILFLGKIIEAKGVYVLLQALKSLGAEGIPFELLVAGNGELDQFNEYVVKSGLGDRAQFLGWKEGVEKEELLRSVDVFALPSRSEGFSVAIVEAMSASLAIVSTAIPGVVDAIEPEVSGLLVVPDDPGSLSVALKRLVVDSELRRILGVAARERFLGNFTMPRVVGRLILLYNSILD